MLRPWTLLPVLACSGCVELVGRSRVADAGDVPEASVDAAADASDAPAKVPQDVPPIPGCTREPSARAGQELTARAATVVHAVTGTFHVKSAVLDGRGGTLFFGGSASCGRAPNFDAAVVRVGADGALDTGYADGGRLCLNTVAAGEDLQDSFHAAAVDAMGRVVLVGASESPRTLDIRALVARLTPQGALDTSFFGQGWRHLSVVQSVTQGSNVSLWGVALDGERIVAAGSDATPFRLPTQGIVVALLDDGTLDVGFDGDGVLFDNARFFRDVAVRSDGYVVSGTERAVSRVSLRLLDRRGEPVPTFGRAGVAVDELTDDAFAGDLLVGAAGDVFVVRAVVPSGGTIQSAHATVVHFTADGRADLRFGEGGAYQTGALWPYSYSHGHHLARHCGGRLLFASQAPGAAPPLRVHRITADGRADATFGTEGIATLATSGRPGVIEGAAGVAVAPDSAEVHVMSGSSSNDMVVARVAAP